MSNASSLYQQVINDHNLELLEWLKINGLHPEGENIWYAAKNGDFWFIRWCNDNGFLWKDNIVCDYLASRGELDNLKWAIDQGCLLGLNMYGNALKHIDIIEYLATINYPIPRWLKKEDFNKLSFTKECHPNTFALVERLS